MKTLSVSILSTLSVVGASSDFSGSPNASPYYYSEISSVDYNHHAENDDMQLPYTTEADDFSDSAPSVVASSLLYEGGCFVSSQAMMCNGGESASIKMETLELFDSEDDDEDDEDDDEDDGHSSMLSNASLRRSLTLADGSSASQASKSSSRSATSAPTAAFFQEDANLNNKQTATDAALMVRGGGLASYVANHELVKKLLVSAIVTIANNELAKKLLVAAIVTLVFEGSMGHVMEFFKIVMQTSPEGTTYGKVFKDITSEKGISGMWDGFVPWGVIQAVLKGGVFGLAHATAIKFLLPLAEQGTIPMQLAMTLAGGIGGGFQGYVLSPTLLMKTRVMTNPVFREQMSMLKTTGLSFCIGADVVRNEGFSTLMKGANVFATKRVFDWSTRYFFSDLFESFFVQMKGSALSTAEKGISSFLGGVASTIITLPLDVLVANTQDAKKAGVKVSAAKMFKDELNEKGWSGLRQKYMQGFEARLLHVCLTTVVLKTGAPIVYEKIFGVSS
jgi:hypothetical protein